MNDSVYRQTKVDLTPYNALLLYEAIQNNYKDIFQKYLSFFAIGHTRGEFSSREYFMDINNWDIKEDVSEYKEEIDELKYTLTLKLPPQYIDQDINDLGAYKIKQTTLSIYYYVDSGLIMETEDSGYISMWVSGDVDLDLLIREDWYFEIELDETIEYYRNNKND